MTTPTSYDVRAELESLLERDLLGPRDGQHEELPPGMPPAERYLVGRLVPRTRPSEPPAELAEGDTEVDDPSLIDQEVTDGAAEPDETGQTGPAVRTGTMAASALGLSFRVPLSVERLTVTASWGAYAPAPSELHLTEQGRPRSTWHRTPAGGSVEVDLLSPETLVVDPEREGIVLRPTVRKREGTRVVDLALVNDQPAPDSSIDTARIYQTSLTVTALDGAAAIFLGHNDPELSLPDRYADAERQHLSLLYRAHREYAKGRQCAVDASVHEGELRAWRLRTTCFPAADVPLTEAGDPRTMPGVELDMARLGSPELGRDDLVRALRPIVTGYRAWLTAQGLRLDDPEIQRYGTAGRQALAAAEGFTDRLDRSIDLLREDGQAREAFRFANQAMALQRVRSELTRARMADPTLEVAATLQRLEVPRQRSWRPFQLAFVLLCLPGLTDPGHQDAGRDAEGEAQLLFFPTGGGKTEAYLGLTAYTLALRRLQGVVGTGPDARDGTDGVAVLMRYTLRLLTAQQFQRAAALLCACEVLRRERLDGGDGRWGQVPFRLGLWVGSRVSPNTYDQAKEAIDNARGSADVGGPLQLAACPWCGWRLSLGADVKTDDRERRVRVFCSDPEGDCVFTPRRSDDGLPVLTTDEEVYRLTPSLVIGTVDKFAQLPWRAATAALFGTVETRCPRHGWVLPDQTFCTGVHQKSRGLAGTKPEQSMRLRPPDLIIQDELHLISDALGSMVGLYETLVDHLCTRQQDGRSVRPVLVASTATVRRAADQVEQVFARRLAIFPPQVLDAGETFFSTVTTPSRETPSRRYRGICATGERFKAIEIRVTATVLAHAQALFDAHGAAADPYMTLVDYFTSTRELAGMRRLVEDDVAERLSPAGGRLRRRPEVQELTSRMPSSRIATTLADLERPFDPALDGRVVMNLPTGPDRDTWLAGMQARGVRPMDVLLATSMLQVGVDVQRLGLMLVTGQPKSAAEYIQATSRVGRDRSRPGLVLTMYQWSRPRDLAHFETFGYDHATFGLRVEGLTTTPYSDRALDRGLPAVLVAAVRQGGPANLPNEAARTAGITGQSRDALLQLFRRRAERITHDAPTTAAVVERVQKDLDRWETARHHVTTGKLGYQRGADVTGLLQKPLEELATTFTAPMSLREVEPEIVLQLDKRDRSVAEAPPWTYDDEVSS